MHRLRSLLFVSLAMCVSLMFAPLPAFAQDTVHVVQPGETLFRIALNYGLTTDILAQANGIADPTRIYAGQTLVIPSTNPGADTSSVVVNPLVAGTPTTITISRGETLNSIAQRYGITVEQLMQINSITNPNLIYAGQQLTVFAAPEASAAPADTSAALPAESAAAPTTTHVVQPGEHLAQIAQQYGVSWTVIAQANNIANADTIYAGQTLVIPAPGSVADLGIIAAPQAPLPTITFGKQIVVDLSDQRTYVYQDGVLLRNVLVSTGLPGTPTVQGDFTIYTKLAAQTMTGPGYYLPDVPYVMYFYQGYSFHGTYWHNNFGQPMSHGCVNMPTPEAEWLYSFAEVGTPVHVQW